MNSKQLTFRQQILQGIPLTLPKVKPYNPELNHAPKRKNILSQNEKILAVQNALRYFDPAFHPVLAEEFANELMEYGRIYMYRFKPEYTITARKLTDFPHQSTAAAAIMLMLSNNLDNAVAQHPDELITYGGNGAVFQNWAQYLLTMKYLATMTDSQTLVLYSGHPAGLFPSPVFAPRVVITNGMMVPHYSTPGDWEKFNAMGVTQYGQMTAGSFMYIGPQGIVHGTTITILNAGRKKGMSDLAGRLFVSSGLGGMSGAQPKAAKIAGCMSVIAEINPKVVQKRLSQGWVDEVYTDFDSLIRRIKEAKKQKKPVSLAVVSNIVTLWERLVTEGIHVDLGSDQTSLHNPFAGGYYPVDMSITDAQTLMVENPVLFKQKVQDSLKRQVAAINALCKNGMYFWDYGNAFLLEAGRAGAGVYTPEGTYTYPSYVQDIMGPLCFDYGFGPFRWVCTSSDPRDLEITDALASDELKKLLKKAPKQIRQQLEDNLAWIQQAKQHNLVVGSQARILYANAQGRIAIASAFNNAIKKGKLRSPVVIGRDHHDVSGTDSPFRETANITDGSQFTADMAVHNVIGDSFRGATWVSLHNGGGVGWGEAINGGFGLVLDGTEEAEKKLQSMLFWDVYNGLVRRSWARNTGAVWAVTEELKHNNAFQVTIPALVDENILKRVAKVVR